MNPLYLDLLECIELVKERAQVTDTTKEAAIENLLEDSAGLTYDGVTDVYRPYFTAARFLEQDHQTQKLSKAGDVVFTGLAAVIASLYNQQAGIDQKYQLIISSAFLAPVTLPETTAAVKKGANIGTTSTSLQINF